MGEARDGARQSSCALHLPEDAQDRLGLPFDPGLLPHTKRARPAGKRYPLAACYTPALEAIVRRAFDWLFSRLDYRLAA